MEVTIIVYGLAKEKEKDTLESKMVEKRCEDMMVEFEKNGIPTRLILR